MSDVVTGTYLKITIYFVCAVLENKNYCMIIQGLVRYVGQLDSCFIRRFLSNCQHVWSYMDWPFVFPSKNKHLMRYSLQSCSIQKVMNTSLQMSQRISSQPLWWTTSQPTVLQVYLEHPYPCHTITQLLRKVAYSETNIKVCWWRCKEEPLSTTHQERQYHERRMKARLVMGTQCKMLYSRWSVSPKHTCNQRPRHKAHTDICKKNYYQGTFFSSLIPLWNRRPKTVASATSLEDFRSKLVEIHI